MASSTATGCATCTFDKIIESMCNHQVQEVARIFREETCPGDWDAGWNIRYSTILRRCAEGERPNKLPNPDGWEEDTEIIESIWFRLQLGFFTDAIIKDHGLPMPSGEACLFWHKKTWEQEIEKTMPDLRGSRARIANRLMRGGFIVQPRPEQGPEWIRPWQYLSSAIVLADLPEQETVNLIDKILYVIWQFKESGQPNLIPGI
ncbi:hypothetical protein GGR58DRAFT_507431 [Xylaria digitata]|nr:hypothetical protein GGR58DRAFT_507431 [Xylaria digitata]